MFFDHKPDDTLVILLTGLGHINLVEVKDHGGDRYVTTILDTLISQLQSISRIEVVSFEKHATANEEKVHYEESVTKSIVNTAFAVSNKDKITISFNNVHLTKLDLVDAKYANAFILNFAGTEITDLKLLNYPRLVDVSLYHNQHMQTLVLSNLKIEEAQKKQTTPYFVYNNGLNELVYVIDRRKYSITDRGIVLFCQVNRLQLDEAMQRNAQAKITEKNEALTPTERQKAAIMKIQAQNEINKIKEMAKKWKIFLIGRSDIPAPEDIPIYSKLTGKEVSFTLSRLTLC